jgi:NADPH-dependent ferric siderophore reductase
MNGMPETPRPGKPNLRSWDLEVVDGFDAAPNMRRVVFTAADIGEFAYKPGQAIVFLLPLPDGTIGRRHYTIRAADLSARTIAVDFLKHGDGPSPDWANKARPGDRIEAKGPRGNAWIRPDAAWHLLAGDETCIPAIAHMLETLPADSIVHAFIETNGPGGEIPIASPGRVDLRWLHRGGPAGPSDLMLDALNGFAFPEGSGHAIIIGETSNVRRQRHALIARGFPRERISSEGYWRPGRVGGHDHVDD